MNVYLVVLVEQPTQKQIHDDGAVPKIVSGPHAVIAKDETQAGAKAIKFLPEGVNADRVEVAVLSFRRPA